MKRLLLLSAALVAVAAVATAGASGTPPPSSTSLTLNQPANVTIANGASTASITLSGTIHDSGRTPDVTVYWTAGDHCGGPVWQHRNADVAGGEENGHSFVRTSEHAYSFTMTTALSRGGYSFKASHDGHWSNCVIAHVLPAVEAPSIEVSAPESATVGTEFAVGGTLRGPGGQPAGDKDVYVGMVAGGCEMTELHVQPISSDADGDFAASFTPTEVGTFGIVAKNASFGTTVVDCVEITVGATEVTAAPKYVPGVIPDTYLCWNRQMTDPVAYADDVADAMWKTGNYFEPQAILGNIKDGTNVGAYHLVCNAPSTMTMTDTAIGGSGEVYDAAAVAAYHRDHPVSGNDLNIYHVWK